jgi:hypothetical protein
MKKKIRTAPLTLCRETLLALQDPELHPIKGGSESAADGCTVSRFPVRSPCA